MPSRQDLRQFIRGGPGFLSPTTGPLYYWVFQFFPVAITSATTPTPFFGTKTTSKPVEYLRIVSVLTNTTFVTIGQTNVAFEKNGIDELAPGETLVIETENESGGGPGLELIDAAQFFGILSGAVTANLMVTTGYRDQRGRTA